MVESAGSLFAIEKEIVIGSVHLPYRTAKTIWRDREIRFRGTRLPLINLFRLLRLKGRVEPKDKKVVLVKKAGKTLAILVDRLSKTKEIPSKSIREGGQVAYIRGIAPIGRGRNLYLLDTDRMAVEF